MPEGSVHRNVLKDDVLDAFAKPSPGTGRPRSYYIFSRPLVLLAPYASVSINMSSFSNNLLVSLLAGKMRSS